jgi:ATPase subunit of ABC transporter with duplicated ATPase domains
VLISGPVAGGKSTLLQSLVGNTEQLAGALRVPQSVAFQPQVLSLLCLIHLILAYYVWRIA